MFVRRLYLLEVSMWQKTLPALETILVRFHAPIIITSNLITHAAAHRGSSCGPVASYTQGALVQTWTQHLGAAGAAIAAVFKLINVIRRGGTAGTEAS